MRSSVRTHGTNVASWRRRRLGVALATAILAVVSGGFPQPHALGNGSELPTPADFADAASEHERAAIGLYSRGKDEVDPEDQADVVEECFQGAAAEYYLAAYAWEQAATLHRQAADLPAHREREGQPTLLDEIRHHLNEALLASLRSAKDYLQSVESLLRSTCPGQEAEPVVEFGFLDQALEEEALGTMDSYFAATQTVEQGLVDATSGLNALVGRLDVGVQDSPPVLFGIVMNPDGTPRLVGWEEGLGRSPTAQEVAERARRRIREALLDEVGVLLYQIRRASLTSVDWTILQTVLDLQWQAYLSNIAGDTETLRLILEALQTLLDMVHAPYATEELVVVGKKIGVILGSV